MATQEKPLIGSTEEMDMEKGQCPHEQDADQIRLAKLGTFGIIGESIKCYWNQRQSFNPVMLRFGFPVLVYLILVQIASQRLLIRPSSVSHQPRFSPSGSALTSASADPHELADRIIRLWTVLVHERNFQVMSQILWKAMPSLGILTISSLAYEIFQASWDSGTIYTVGLIYCRPSLLIKTLAAPYRAQVLRKAPRLVNRFLLTWIWTFFFMMFLVFNFLVSLFVIDELRLGLGWTMLLDFILLTSFLVCAVALRTLGDVAQSVAILDPEESSYGLKALKKARVLLRGKWRVAFRLVFVWASMLWFINFIQPAPFVSNQFDPIRVLVIAMTSVAVWTVHARRTISIGVLYVSLKASHGESIGGLEMDEEDTKSTTISRPTSMDGLAEKIVPGADLRHPLISA